MWRRNPSAPADPVAQLNYLEKVYSCVDECHAREMWFFTDGASGYALTDDKKDAEVFRRSSDSFLPYFVCDVYGVARSVDVDKIMRAIMKLRRKKAKKR